MEKVKIISCDSIMGGKAHGVKLADGRQCTAWNDKIDAGALMQAYASGKEIEMMIVPYTSRAGKTGLNITGINSGDVVENDYIKDIRPNTQGTGITPEKIVNAPNPQRVGLYIKLAVEMLIHSGYEGKNVEENLCENIQEIKKLEEFTVGLLSQ